MTEEQMRKRIAVLEQTETPVEEAGDVERVFINNVWNVLKSDSNDLRKQQKILRLFRAAMRPVSPAISTDELEELKDLSSYVGAGLTDDSEGLADRIRWGIDHIHAATIQRVVSMIEEKSKSPSTWGELLQSIKGLGYEPAMRPVSVDAQKLAEIRGRHEALINNEFPSEDEVWKAHADRAFLLSAIEGVNHDAD